MKSALKRTVAPSEERQVRAVVVCRPPLASDSRRMNPGGGLQVGATLDGGPALEELEITDPVAAGQLAPGAPDADLCRDIAAEKGTVLRMPVYGYRSTPASELCTRELTSLLGRVRAGESAAIIAYGATGSGKSYTMGTERYGQRQGPAEHSVSAFCAEGVFELAKESNTAELEVKLAAIEIYRWGSNQEQLVDLQDLGRPRLQRSLGQDATWQTPTSAEELQGYILAAAHVRNTGSTDGNARSSRSHAIFIINVQFKRRLEDGSCQRVKAQLMLVDLAGSEHAMLAQAGSTTQKEGAGINVGLMWLKNVIRELAEKKKAIYSNSKLTKLLQPALGGGSNEVTSSCNTLILGCISPLAIHTANTSGTLRFIQSAGNVKNVVRADVQQLRQLELAAENEDLKRVNQDLTRQLQGLKLQLGKQQQRQPGEQQSFPDGGPTASEAAKAGPSPASPQGAAWDGEDGGDGAAAAAALSGVDEGAYEETEAEKRIAALEAELESTRADVAELRVEVVVQRDRADAYMATLQKHEMVAAAAEAAAAAAAAEARAAGQGHAAAGEGGVAGTPLGEAARPGVDEAGPSATPASISGASPAPLLGLTAAASATAGTPLSSLAAGRPSLALLAASPVLAASRAVGEWVAEAAASEAATPAGQRLPLLRLLPGVEQICAEEDSQMRPEELAALKEKVGQLLSEAEDTDDHAQSLAFAKAALYSVLAYNKCLAEAVGRAGDLAEDLQEANQQNQQLQLYFEQVCEEKARYMKEAAAAGGGLSNYQVQVEELEAKLASTRKALEQAQQGTPGRWASIGRLISGSGRSPPADGSGGGGSSGGGQNSRRSSIGGSPGSSPHQIGVGGSAGHPQQRLFGSPSRLGSPMRYSPDQQAQQNQRQQQKSQMQQQSQHQEQESQKQGQLAAGDGTENSLGDSGEARCITVAHVRRAEDGSVAAAAAEAFLSSKQRKAAAALLSELYVTMAEAEGQEGEGQLLKAVGLAIGEGPKLFAVAATAGVAAPKDSVELKQGLPAGGPAEAAPQPPLQHRPIFEVKQEHQHQRQQRPGLGLDQRRSGAGCMLLHDSGPLACSDVDAPPVSCAGCAVPAGCQQGQELMSSSDIEAPLESLEHSSVAADDSNGGGRSCTSADGEPAGQSLPAMAVAAAAVEAPAASVIEEVGGAVTSRSAMLHAGHEARSRLGAAAVTAEVTERHSASHMLVGLGAPTSQGEGDGGPVSQAAVKMEAIEGQQPLTALGGAASSAAAEGPLQPVDAVAMPAAQAATAGVTELAEFQQQQLQQQTVAGHQRQQQEKQLETAVPAEQHVQLRIKPEPRAAPASVAPDLQQRQGQWEEQQSETGQEQQHGPSELQHQHQHQSPADQHQHRHQHAHQTDQQERQQHQQQKHQQQQEGPVLLPGPCIAVLVPAAGPSRKGRGASTAGSHTSLQELDYCPADGTFSLPGSEAVVDPLQALRKVLPAGEPWQRHVLLKAPGPSQLSGVTLERWLSRRTLLPGRCHFCCRAEPDPGCRHPEAALLDLQLCQDCHEALEPDIWRTGESWVSEEPSDPGYLWCLMCGGAGVGNTTELVMCSSCKLCGFCTGCLWRFTNDDLAPATAEDAQFTCLLCRPEPRLQLLYAPHRDPPGSNLVSGLGRRRGGAASGSKASGISGGDGSHGRGATATQAACQVAGVARERLDGRMRRAVGSLQQAELPGDDFVVDLADSSSDEAVEEASSSSSSSEDEKETPLPPRRPDPVQRQPATRAAATAAKQRGGSQPPRRRKAMGNTQAVGGNAGASAASALQAKPPAVPARKRNRLLATGDLVSSPGTDGERPVQQRQRMQLQQGQRRQQGGPGKSVAVAGNGSSRGLQSQPSLSSQLKDLLHL